MCAGGGSTSRRSLADDSDFIATIGDLDSGVVDASPAAIFEEGGSRRENLGSRDQGGARVERRIIRAGRAQRPSDSSSTPASSSSGKEGERHDQAPTAFGSLRARCASPASGQFLPRVGARTGETVNSVADRRCGIADLALVAASRDGLGGSVAGGASDAAPPAAGVAPAPSIDSTSQIREPFELARSELLAAIRAGGGPALLTGPAGVGKTTLCRALIQDLDRRTVASVVSGAPQSFDDLLKMMLVSFGVMTTETSAAAHAAQSMLMSTLDCFLESLVVLRARAVVFIDDAHKIPAAVLAELAAMRAPGSPSARVLQLVLVGRPSLRSRAQTRRLEESGREYRAAHEPGSSPRPRICRRCGAAGRVLNSAPTDSAAVDLSPGSVPHSFADCSSGCCSLPPLSLIVLAGVLWVWRDAVSRTILQ